MHSSSIVFGCGLLLGCSVFLIAKRRNGFLPGHRRNAREDDDLELNLGNNSRLTLLFVKDDSLRYYNVSVRYAAPDDTKYPNYADAMAKMGGSCKLP
ncbi:MAG: hypothetical protein IPN71_11335 [Fibrobacteres bacterium]|nr:hypothetical protein [Fibrobacterota bacterium]